MAGFSFCEVRLGAEAGLESGFGFCAFSPGWLDEDCTGLRSLLSGFLSARASLPREPRPRPSRSPRPA